jgi:5-formyltetrahydrofolate cyclo-ligase
MNPNLAEAKRRLRFQLPAAVRNMPPSAKAEGSQAICSRLPGQAVWSGAQTILFYAPMADEVDIRPLIHLAMAQGKRVAFPRFDPATRQYAIASVERPEQDLVPGHFGILEPRAACPALDGRELDLVLVPGVGFSPEGWRLGHGRGYFDRLLAVAGGVWCGVAFDCQVILEVPSEPHDIRLHYIATPTRWLECQARQVEA